RTDVALYALPEPGPGRHSVAASRYPLTYPSGPADVETLLINPSTGAKYVVTKGLFAGDLLELPRKLSTDHANKAKVTGHDMPALTTDGVVSADGRYALLRTYNDVDMYDATSWKTLRSDVTPSQPQGESIAIERSQKSYLIGSEGADSELIRMPLTVSTPAPPTTTDEPAETSATDSASADGDGFAGSFWLWGIGGAVVVTAIAITARRRT
ncbi:MAG: hypothetical protein QOH68_240, partial [Nocardioidaceae bacterium]|nr:hypothetical protein [Nocardioidaceae bacterium]